MSSRSHEAFTKRFHQRPAEVSRTRGRSAFASRPPSAARALCWPAPACEELVPVFDPLEHLLSRNRGAAGRNSDDHPRFRLLESRALAKEPETRDPLESTRSRAPPFQLPAA